MDVDVQPTHLSDDYLSQLLECAVDEEREDTSGVLDYNTPEALCLVLRPTYAALPRLKYVSSK